MSYHNFAPGFAFVLNETRASFYIAVHMPIGCNSLLMTTPVFMKKL